MSEKSPAEKLAEDFEKNDTSAIAVNDNKVKAFIGGIYEYEVDGETVKVVPGCKEDFDG